MRLSLSKNLDPLKNKACAEIDGEAENIRGRYITLGSGQAMVYDQKRTEAEAYIAAYNAGQTLPQGEIPHLAAEADRNGVSLFDQAVIYLTLRQQWLTVSPIIENARLAAKDAVMAATTPAEIEMAKVIDWSGMAAMGPS